MTHCKETVLYNTDVELACMPISSYTVAPLVELQASQGVQWLQRPVCTVHVLQKTWHMRPLLVFAM